MKGYRQIIVFFWYLLAGREAGRITGVRSYELHCSLYQTVMEMDGQPDVSSEIPEPELLNSLGLLLIHMKYAHLVVY